MPRDTFKANLEEFNLNDCKGNALFFNDATETLEFDMHEFPEFMSPPRLLKRDNSDHYLEFSDLSNEEDHEDIDFLQLLLSSPSN